MNEWLRALLSIGLVLGLVWLLRRRLTGRAGAWIGRRPRRAKLEALERLALTPQHSLHLVRIGDRAVLIGAHAGGLSLLENLPATALDQGRQEASS